MENKNNVTRFEWTAETAPRIRTNDDLICKDCLFKGKKSGICSKYPSGKPGSVFNSEKYCRFYTKQ